MNKYVVTFKAMGLMNSEIEVNPVKADEIRAELGKQDRPVLGRDWAWSEVEKVVVIEADSYSVSNEGSAHFYRDIPGRTPHPRETQPSRQLVASITEPVTVTIQGDPGVSAPKGTGGIGKIPWAPWPEGSTDWYYTKGFPPGTFTNKVRSGSAMINDMVASGMNHAEASRMVRDWLRDGMRFGAQSQESPPEPETPRTIRIVIRYHDTDGRVRKHAEIVDTKMCPPEIHVDLRNPTSRNPVRNPLTNEPLGPGEVIA